MTRTQPEPPAAPARLGSLIGLTARQWRRAVDLRLQPFDLTEATWLPLLHLARSAGAMRQKDLAAALSVDSSAVVRILNTLAAAGLITRDADAGDRRARAIVITRAGRRLVSRVEAVSEGLEQDLLTGLDAAQVATARTVLERISGQLARPDDRTRNS